MEAVEPENQAFNPEFHQAMSKQPSAEVPPNQVVGVLQKGYLLNGRLLRPRFGGGFCRCRGLIF